MGAIEELRRVVQDLITPDLKAIAVKLEMLEKRMDRLEDTMQDEFERVDRNAERRMNQLFIAFGHEERIKQLESERRQELEKLDPKIREEGKQ